VKLRDLIPPCRDAVLLALALATAGVVLAMWILNALEGTS
jgi:hypothetical protein